MSHYLCYMLVSDCTGPEPRTYIGCTNNLKRRLREHNGEITGGARETASYRPWRVALTVRHFATSVDALKFESAWQRLGTTRHLKEHRQAGRVMPGATFSNRFIGALHLSVCKFYRPYALNVHIHCYPARLSPAVEVLLPQHPQAFVSELEIERANESATEPQQDEDIF